MPRGRLLGGRLYDPRGTGGVAAIPEITGVGAASLAGPTVSGAGSFISVPVDGPGSVYVPADATDWTELGLPAPSQMWLCQESSGDLIRTIGSVDLVDNGSGLLYQQSVTGWTRKFVGQVSGTSHGWYVGTTAALNFGANESFAWLFYAALSGGASNTTYLGSGGWAFGIANGDLWPRVLYGNGAGSVEGTIACSDVTTVRPWLVGRNCATSAGRLFNELEQVNITYSGAAWDGTGGSWHGIFNTANTRNSRIGLVAFWKGTDAETVLAKSTLTTLGWSLGY